MHLLAQLLIRVVQALTCCFKGICCLTAQTPLFIGLAIKAGLYRRSAAAADKSGGMGAPDNGKPRTAPAAVQRPTAMEATPAVPNAQIADLTI